MWGMSPVELSILSTLALYAAEGRSALTQNEIYFYLHISLSFPLPLSFPRRALPKPCAKEGKRESRLILDSMSLDSRFRGNDTKTPYNFTF